MEEKKITEEMPRERLEKFGVSALSNSELLSLIIASGTKNKSVTAISSALLAKSGGLRGLFDLDRNDLMSIEGIGRIKAGQLLAIFEMAKRFNHVFDAKKVLLNKPVHVFHFIKSKFIGEKRECIYCLSLNSKNELISADLVSIGTVNYSVAHPREIFQFAIRNSAVSIILVHNHPSGNVEPSSEDIQLTKRIEHAGTIIGIKLTDHVIVSDCAYYSLRENRYL